MCHHFHDPSHPAGQGSISADQFQTILDGAGCEKISLALNWVRMSEEEDLGERDLCITFDDGLRCQFDIACPVLKKNGQTAFWFVFSSFLRGGINRNDA